MNCLRAPFSASTSFDFAEGMAPHMRCAMLSLIQERMGHAPFESFDPVMFHIDTGAVRVRRILDSMVAAESSR